MPAFGARFSSFFTMAPKTFRITSRFLSWFTHLCLAPLSCTMIFKIFQLTSRFVFLAHTSSAMTLRSVMMMLKTLPWRSKHLLSWFSGFVPWFSRLARMILKVTHALLVMTLQSLPWLARFLPWPSRSLQRHTFVVMTFSNLYPDFWFFPRRSNLFRDSRIFCHGSPIVYHDFQKFCHASQDFGIYNDPTTYWYTYGRLCQNNKMKKQMNHKMK